MPFNMERLLDRADNKAAAKEQTKLMKPFLEEQNKNDRVENIVDAVVQYCNLSETARKQWDEGVNKILELRGEKKGTA